MKKLYGGEKGYETLLDDAATFFDGIPSWIPSENRFIPTVPLIRRLKGGSDKTRARLEAAGGFGADIRHDGKLGGFTGYSTSAYFEENPANGRVSLIQNVTTDDQVDRAVRDAAQFGVSATTSKPRKLRNGLMVQAVCQGTAPEGPGRLRGRGIQREDSTTGVVGRQESGAAVGVAAEVGKKSRKEGISAGIFSAPPFI